MFKVCICGCRDFYDYDFFEEKCLKILVNKMPDVIIISGGATGADALAEQFAKKYKLKNEIYKADWNKYGKSAGPKRNEQMVQIADAIIAFWDGISRGTRSTIEFSKQYNKPIRVIKIGDV